LRVLVTGAAGFIGSHLCEALLARGDDVCAIDDLNDFYDPARKRANLAGFRKHPRCHFAELDIRDEPSLRRLFAERTPDAVAHLAAYGNVRYSIGRAPLYTDVNIAGSVNVLECARTSGTSTFVFASTSSIYGATEQLPFVESDPCNRPLAPYPASKKAVEVLGYTYHNLHEIHFTSLRFFSVYGPRGRPDMMPYLVTDRIVRGEEIALFDAGRMQRDWTYVEDVTKGVVAALDRSLGYEIINLGRGQPVLMSDFVETIEDLVGRKAVLVTPAAPASEPKVTYASIERARQLLDYDPKTDVADGLAELWDWYRKAVLA
jgi:UDP-glucuronate 4-epimerase